MEIASTPDVFTQVDKGLNFEQPVDSPLDSSATEDSGGIIRYDAADLNLDGYQIENVADGQIISLADTGVDNGSAEGFFTGPTGLYEVSVGYYDENDGVSDVSVTVNDETDSFALDKDLPGNLPTVDTFTTRVTHDAVQLESGDSFAIAGTIDQSEYARFDYIEFKPVAETGYSDRGSDTIGADEALPVLDGDIELNPAEESGNSGDSIDSSDSDNIDSIDSSDSGDSGDSGNSDSSDIDSGDSSNSDSIDSGDSIKSDSQAPLSINYAAADQYPVVEQFAQAGVEGGIPSGRPVVVTINPGDDIQAAIESASSAGGGVILLKSGTYQVNSAINLESNVTLRGEDRDSVVVESSIRSTIGEGQGKPGRKDSTFVFDNDSNAGIENLTIEYQVPGLEPVDREGLVNGGRYDEAFTNDPSGRNDLHVRGIYISKSSSNNWINGVSVLKSGTDPIVVEGDHNTLTNNFVDQSYNKGVDGAGYYTIAGDYNLVKGETVERIRHFAVQGGAAYNVVVDSNFQVDINFHNGDDGNNLIQSNTIEQPSWNPWKPFETGGAQFGHDTPGSNNILFDNKTKDFNSDGSAESPFAKDGVIYTFTGYGDPVETNLAAPNGGTFYN